MSSLVIVTYHRDVILSENACLLSQNSLPLFSSPLTLLFCSLFRCTCVLVGALAPYDQVDVVRWEEGATVELIAARGSPTVTAPYAVWGATLLSGAGGASDSMLFRLGGEPRTYFGFLAKGARPLSPVSALAHLEFENKRTNWLASAHPRRARLHCRIECFCDTNFAFWVHVFGRRCGQRWLDHVRASSADAPAVAVPPASALAVTPAQSAAATAATAA
eukprot:2780239-Pleurochrysis_carterae.AAC.2